MSSAAQIKANRRNGARSRGPISEAGKKRASRNRLVYTIEPRSFIAPGEDQVAFRDLARMVLEQYPPRSRFERRIVHRLIAQIWQCDRLLRIEQAMLGDREAVSKLPLALRRGRGWTGEAVHADRASDPNRRGDPTERDPHH